jgi:hypothetical protein
MTHDYKRHGTTTLFAGMNVADGTVISTFMPTHNHQDWIRFLKLIHKKTPKDKDVHLILDNYGTHQTPRGSCLAGQASPLPSAFHADQFFLAQPGGALLPGSDRQMRAARSISPREGTGAIHPALHRRAQSQAQTVSVDGQSQRHGKGEAGLACTKG